MGKNIYRIRNWSQYNKSLVQRGSINVWFSEESIKKWKAEQSINLKGRPFIYSDDAILTALIIKSVFHLPLRALEGFLNSIVLLMGIALPIPCYTQISRRAKCLGKKLEKFKQKNVTDLVFDSTGLKVYGEGEWKVRQHGAGKRRTWRKLHLAICPDSHSIVLGSLTENSVADCEVYPNMMRQAPRTVKNTYCDGAYDTKECYRANHDHGSTIIVPPRKNGAIKKDTSPWMKNRNKSLLEIKGLGGDEEARKIWKILHGYHRRSIAETGMYRFKTLFGSDLKSRSIETQRSEVKAKCEALNRMTELGMPKGKWI